MRVRADRLYRFYHTGDEETLALQGISLVVAGGEMIAISGPSGSGKSTLLACLAGLDDPDGGTVTIDGTRISRRPEAERAAIRARRIGVLLQVGNLIGHLSVGENVLLAQRLAGRADPARIGAVLDRVGLALRSRHHPSELSRGEMARAGLAVALANAPEIVLADEPTGELDDASEQRVLCLLQETARNGAAVLVATHSRAVAESADRVLVLEDGKLAG